MRTTVNLTLSYAVIGRPADQEPRYAYENVDVLVEEFQLGKTRKLFVTLHQPLKGVGEFNQARITINGNTLEGIAHNIRERNLIIISLYRDQASECPPPP